VNEAAGPADGIACGVPWAGRRMCWPGQGSPATLVFRMTQLRLIADDLTGALDTAVQFARPGRPIPVFLNGRLPASMPGSFAVDSCTRELDGDAATSIASRLAFVLEPLPGTLSFKKMDSLLRGHPGAELAAVLGAAPARHCIVAPAFPVHGRVTRGGLQWAHSDGQWRESGEDLRATLRSRGVAVALARPGDGVPEGVSLWDAETDGDLRHIAQAGLALQSPVLWCGSGGLAAAIAGGPVPSFGALERPTLVLVGTDHPASAAQLDACGEHVLKLDDGGDAGSALVSARLDGPGVAVVHFEVPFGLDRAGACARIARGMSGLTRRIRAPRSLVVTGGETLRGLCLCLGVERIDGVGQIFPGVPVSILRGGRWDGVPLASKSGAFGDRAMLREILGLGVSPGPRRRPAA
jgi:D-threonate/D-erythronate kinase